ncbi:MAG: PilZ domain-containing protein [Desulfobacteraceae bacterium]|nr:PilZ domain-containing protein [Desulfobacteraceae bacterium]
MNHSTIEFTPVPEDVDQPVRHFFRVPVKERESIFVLISSISYPVSDLSQEGVGILVENNQAFQIGETLFPCQLHLKDTQLKDMTGKVVHCSVQDSDFWQFGIQWINLESSQKKVLEQVFSRLKNRVLASQEAVVQKDPGGEK